MTGSTIALYDERGSEKRTRSMTQSESIEKRRDE